jgi:hypothetical protein
METERHDASFRMANNSLIHVLERARNFPGAAPFFFMSPVRWDENFK